MRESLFTTPPVHPFVECPNCRRLFEFGATQCPHCREEINPKYAQASASVIILNTQACSLANSIKTAEPGAIIVFLVSAFGVFLYSPSLLIVSFLTPVISLAAIILWFNRFGRFRAGDEEYLKAKARMRGSLKLWLALLAVQLLLLLYLLRPGSDRQFHQSGLTCLSPRRSAKLSTQPADTSGFFIAEIEGCLSINADL